MVEEFGARHGEFLEQSQPLSEASCVSAAGKFGSCIEEFLVGSEQIKDLLMGLQSETSLQAIGDSDKAWV